MAKDNTSNGRKPEDRAEVQEFLDRLAKALTSGDGKAIATMWDVPALVLGDDQVMAVSTEREVEQFFGSAKDQYNAQGITDTRAEIVALRWHTPRLVSVEVRWPYLDAKGTQRGAETSTYTLRRDGSGKFRLRVAVMHGVSG